MKVILAKDSKELGCLASKHAAEKINEAIAKDGNARILLSTGASQFPFFEQFVKEDIDWSKVEMFHLDEYVGLPESHPASFRKYIKERFIAQLPAPLKNAYFVNGSDPDPAKTCEELGKIIAEHPIDVCFIGIGENGHIAFNDPPADFDTENAYLVVDLDEACRKQQLGEGWFPTLDDVPKQAISMSVRQILKSKAIVNTVPDARKAYAMKITFEEEMSPAHPASVIRIHPDCATFCDVPAAAQLSKLTKDFCTK